MNFNMWTYQYFLCWIQICKQNFSIRQSFKDTEDSICENSTLRTNETGRNLPLKCRGVWLSLVIGFSYTPLQCPAIVCQHTWGPLALVPLFHKQNVLVKSLTVFVTDLAHIFWEKIQVGLQKMDFQTHIASHSFVRSQQVLHNILIVRCSDFLRSLQIFLKDNHAFLSLSFRCSSNCLSCISCLIWGPINIPSLIFASHIWELILHILEPMACFIHTFHIVFNEAHFYV